MVTDSERTERLLREAGEFAVGGDAELVLLSVDSEGEYENIDPNAMDADELEFTLDEAERSARSRAQTLASEAFADLDVRYTVMGAVGNDAELILDAARKLDCDHIFVAGRRRTPTGKAIFGDLSQQILLSYDGPVTMLLGE